MDQKIIQLISNQRKCQDEQWGGPEHDDEHELKEFLNFIYGQIHHGDVSQNYAELRICFVKIAALAVAAIESGDRRNI